MGGRLQLASANLPEGQIGALHSFLLRPPWPSGLDCFCEALIPKLHLELPFTRYFVVVEKQKYFAQRGARTHDPEIKSLMLYRLS